VWASSIRNRQAIGEQRGGRRRNAHRPWHSSCFHQWPARRFRLLALGGKCLHAMAEAARFAQGSKFGKSQACGQAGRRGTGRNGPGPRMAPGRRGGKPFGEPPFSSRCCAVPSAGGETLGQARSTWLGGPEGW